MARIAAATATLKEWAQAYLAWRIEATAIVQLKSISERELDDIGLSRSEIEATSETRIEKVTDVPKSQRREWVPTQSSLNVTEHGLVLWAIAQRRSLLVNDESTWDRRTLAPGSTMNIYL
jgi:uncharacterized protein YjiS (DUF1127 family)